MESVEEFIERKNSQFIEEKNNPPKIPMKDIGREGKIFFIREAWTFLAQSNLDKKVYVFERLRKTNYEGALAYNYAWKEGDIEYRIGYFIVGRIGRAKGKWIWGQFCPIILSQDFIPLIKKAIEDKVLLESDIKVLQSSF